MFFNYLAGFRRSHRLPIEEIYFRRTNLAFSIRYISERISRLKLRHGRARQLLGSKDSKFEYCPHKYIIAIRVKGGCGR